MKKHKKRRKHTGSVVAQDNKNRDAEVGHPSASRSERDRPTHEGLIPIGNNTRVLSLNVEGLSMAKCEYLSRLLVDNSVDVLLLQETHVGATAAASRYTIQGYHPIIRENHEQYGTIIYAKNPELISIVDSSRTDNNIHTSVINIDGLSIANIYKPPHTTWPDPPILELPHPAVVAGDFNSHHEEWGYQSSDAAGEQIVQWASTADMQLVHDLNQRGTFCSARWHREYNPDLIFATHDENQHPLPVQREVLPDFPNSQHRPILITIGYNIQTSDSLPLPRWNFHKAKWEEYTAYIEEICPRIPTSIENMHRFTRLLLTSAKKYIPRGYRRNYIPCWSERSSTLLREYEQNREPATAEELLDSLREGRADRWKEIMENLDFKHSSRQAWKLIKKLDPDRTKPAGTIPAVGAEEIATEIKNRSKRTPDHTFKRRVRREYQQNFSSSPPTTEMSRAVTSSEIVSAVKQIKNGKAAGVDGVYPDMLTHLGPNACRWLASVLTAVISTARLPATWTHAKVLAILKPGKCANDPESYRPIALLCCGFKLLERIVLSRIQPILDPHIPLDQAGFRHQRDTTEQVLALTSSIEASFENKLKTGAVFVDLSAAYDTVWHTGLMCKLSNIIKCRATLRLLHKMTGKRFFSVCIGQQTSKCRTVSNGVPQGSVLAPSLFNMYISDLPRTTSNRYGYADDLAITTEASSFEMLETRLGQDISRLHSFFKTWYLKMNPTKTFSTVFHLSNKHANRTLDVYNSTGNYILKKEPLPKYLGITLDRSLTYKQHIENTGQKLKKRVSILRKLAGTTWGADQGVLRTTALALCHSVAEYCAPVWARSTHVHKIDVQLNSAMRVITGALKSTPVRWLPVMSAIAPPHLRREAATQRQHQRAADQVESTPLHLVLQQAPATERLKSRKPFYSSLKPNFSLEEEWKREWAEAVPPGGDVIEDPSTALPGFVNLSRREWVVSNRIRARTGRTARSLHMWGYRDSPTCPLCGGGPQDMDHLVLHCPLTAIDGGYQTVHEAGPAVSAWLASHDVGV